METKLNDRVPAAAFRVVSRPSGGERDASDSDRPLLGGVRPDASAASLISLRTG
jgi:hypothetical protein